jgi:hypothetical protein
MFVFVLRYTFIVNSLYNKTITIQCACAGLGSINSAGRLSPSSAVVIFMLFCMYSILGVPMLQLDCDYTKPLHKAIQISHRPGRHMLHVTMLCSVGCFREINKVRFQYKGDHIDNCYLWDVTPCSLVKSYPCNRP